MADASAFTELLPLGPDDTPYRLVTTEGVSTFDSPAGTFVRVELDAITKLTAEAMHDIAHFLRPAHLQQLRNVLDDPEASDNDRFVALDLLKNATIAAGGVLPMCQDTGTAIVKAKKGQYVFTGGGDEAAIAKGVQDTYLTLQPALQPDGAAHDVRRAQHRHQPAGGDQDRQRRRRHVLVPVHRQGRRQRQQVVPVPGDQGAAQRGDAAALAVRQDADHSAPRPARRTTSPSSSAARRPSSPSRRPSSPRPTTSTRCRRPGSELGPRLPRRRARGQGAAARPAHRNRRPVRRQVLLPRRADRPPAAPRGELPGGDGGVVLGRPAGEGQDHARRRVPRAAGDRSGALPPRGDRRPARRHAGRAHRPHPPDGRDPRRAVALPGQDPRDADRPDGRGPRHRPRQDQGAPRRRRADARSTCATTACTTPARPRRRRATRRARSGRRRPGGWTATSSSSRPPAGRW